MEHEILRRLNGDKQTKDVLLAYLISYLESKIVERARQGKEVNSLAEAINVLESAFEQLEIDYAIKEEIKYINEAK